MKTNRNDSCPCGSGKKYKHCCEAKDLHTGEGNQTIRWLIKGAVGVFLAVLVWGIVEFFSEEHPEMEAYKCDNPNCGKIHYRPKTETN